MGAILELGCKGRPGACQTGERVRAFQAFRATFLCACLYPLRDPSNVSFVAQLGPNVPIPAVFLENVSGAPTMCQALTINSAFLTGTSLC